MIRHTFVLPLFFLTVIGAATAAPAEDLLRFTNGDQLHGSFGGISEGPSVSWKRADLDDAIDFKTSKVRHVVMRGGRPLKSLESLSHVGLVNGDRIPGTVSSIDDEFIILQTGHSGELRIPRKQVSMIAPNPLGGRVYYHGPFASEDWKMAHPAFPDGFPPAADKPEQNPPEDGAEEPAGGDEEKDDGETAELPGLWEFSGAAWYWQHKRGGTALVRESGMPERSVLRFDLAWKNRLSIAIAFNADFAKPDPVEEEDEEEGEDEGKKKNRARVIDRILNNNPNDSSNLPRIFGNSYVLQIYTNYLMLFRTSFKEDGAPSVQRVHLNNSNLKLADTNRASIELRSNRATGGITLFINGEFVSQWSDADFAGRGGDGDEDAAWTPGSGFGFLAQGEDMPVRISDIVVSEWNGMPDSARSMQVDDRDVILMANGTDRYAGSVGTLDEDGRMGFEGKHGSFQFPLEDIAEVRFARDSLAPAIEESAGKLLVRFSPIGSISGRPVPGNGGPLLQLLHPVIGEINLSTDSAVMLEFNSSNHLIDDWDANF
jgi:hypothetical protein